MQHKDDSAQTTHQVAVSGGSVTVSLRGEFDLAVEADLHAWLAKAMQDHPGLGIEVDMSEVTFMDSSGIRALLIAYRTAVAEDRRFRLVGATEGVRDVLEMVDVYDLLVET